MDLIDREWVLSNPEKPSTFVDAVMCAPTVDAIPLSVVEEIKTEIIDEAEFAYADFDRYKEEILGVESDELPDDDFRYGLERAFEIINRKVKEHET